ncbi:hypothetical protein NA57DRAFT_56950 [Rhizodiscina lignyota]|uniref:Something about silencing protein 4 domain-containing protein n=1 Tax=Rhizodiscina lignyota TaxID=1504668 RepID=A0A9P4M7X7_9PEZI|nr:hypothetical protein NA57DRAFT_56950 [Rhizodiscina lignyota]
MGQSASTTEVEEPTAQKPSSVETRSRSVVPMRDGHLFDQSSTASPPRQIPRQSAPVMDQAVDQIQPKMSTSRKRKCISEVERLLKLQEAYGHGTYGTPRQWNQNRTSEARKISIIHERRVHFAEENYECRRSHVDEDGVGSSHEQGSDEELSAINIADAEREDENGQPSEPTQRVPPHFDTEMSRYRRRLREEENEKKELRERVLRECQPQFDGLVAQASNEEARLTRSKRQSMRLAPLISQKLGGKGFEVELTPSEMPRPENPYRWSTIKERKRQRAARPDNPFHGMLHQRTIRQKVGKRKRELEEAGIPAPDYWTLQRIVLEEHAKEYEDLDKRQTEAQESEYSKGKENEEDPAGTSGAAQGTRSGEGSQQRQRKRRKTDVGLLKQQESRYHVDSRRGAPVRSNGMDPETMMKSSGFRSWRATSSPNSDRQQVKSSFELEDPSKDEATHEFCVSLT